MVRIHGFVPAWGLPDFSPFCNKVHTYLHMRGLEFQTKVADPRKAPLGKLPGLELEDGTMVYDSRLAGVPAGLEGLREGSRDAEFRFSSCSFLRAA